MNRSVGDLEMPKLAQILEQSSRATQVCRFSVAVQSQKTSHGTHPRLVCHFFLFCFVFTTFWRYLWSIT